MVRTHALMEAVSANLHEFLHSIDADLTRPQKKFLRDGVVGLLRAGRPVVCRMARKLPDQRTKFLSRLDRLEDNLNRQSDLEEKLKVALPALWLPLIRNETPIILDLSDIAKPLAKKMDYLAAVRDGSTGQLVNGYWLVELYASVSRKNPVPIFLELFSHEQPFCRGQNPHDLRVMSHSKPETVRPCKTRSCLKRLTLQKAAPMAHVVHIPHHVRPFMHILCTRL